MKRQALIALHVLGMDRLDPWPELFEELADHRAGVVQATRAADEVHGIEMHTKGGAIDGPDEFEVAIGRVRKNPRHRLERVERGSGLHGIDDATHAFHDEIERGPGEVVGVWPVPAIRTA